MITMSNSRPFARCSVMTCTRARLAPAAARAKSIGQRLENAGPVGDIAAALVLGEQREKALGRVEVDRARRRRPGRRARARRRARAPTSGTRPRSAIAGVRCAPQPCERRRARPPTAARSHPPPISATIDRTGVRVAAARPARRDRLASGRTTARAAPRASASRSSGCISACVSETRSRIACRSASASRSTAAKANAGGAQRRQDRVEVRCARARASRPLRGAVGQRRAHVRDDHVALPRPASSRDDDRRSGSRRRRRTRRGGAVERDRAARTDRCARQHARERRR